MPHRPVTHLIETGTVAHVAADMPVFDALRYMAKVKRGAVPVIDDGRLVGMFSERDLMIRVVLAGKDPSQTLVSEVMSRELVVAQAQEDSRECLAKMKQLHVRHLPVIDGDELVGILSLRDLMQAEDDLKSQEIDMLSYYVGYKPE